MNAATVVVSLLAFLFGQMAADPGIVDGYVFRADSAQPVPVPGATVWLDSDHDSRTITNEAGYFRFMSVKPGKHTVAVGSAGYVLAEYNQRAPGLPGMPITVHEGRKTDPLIFQLVPTGVATGVILDYDNEPIANTLVQLIRERYRSNGERYYAPMDAVRTDDRGVFRFYWITPGEYLLATSPRAPYGALAGKPNLTPRLDRVPAYYPGVTNPAQAVPIIVRSGEVLGGLLITLTEPHRSTVRGTILDSRTGKGIRAKVRLGISDIGVLAERESDAEGRYEFSDIPSGTYTISASLLMPDAWLRGSRSFELGVLPLTEIDVPMEAGHRLVGQITAEDGQALDWSRMLVLLPAAAHIRSNGHFEADVYGGDLDISLSFPDDYSDYYIKSARIGRADVLNIPYTVQGDLRDPLEIVISPASATIKGVILDSQNTPYASARVVLVPIGQARFKLQDYKTAQTNQNGTFMIQGIPPGEYTLFAWDTIEEYAYYSRDFLRQYERDGTRITLQRSETLDLRLPLITR